MNLVSLSPGPVHLTVALTIPRGSPLAYIPDAMGGGMVSVPRAGPGS